MMKIKNFINKETKTSSSITSFLKSKYSTLNSYIDTLFYLTIRKRVSFNYEYVSSNWRVKGAGLPHFSARIYREVKLLKEAIGSYHAKKSLEIGCGYGRLTPWIADHSDEHYAIEPEPTLLKDAKMLNPDVSFYKVRAQKLPFPDNYFDLCVSWTVLQHIPPQKELIKAINEIKRVCAPEAIIILVEGIGVKKTNRYWEHPLEEWVNYLKPWSLTLRKERKLEETFDGNAGLLMKFEINDVIQKFEALKTETTSLATLNRQAL